MSKKGFIYILLNPSFVHYVKIGKTQRSSEERAREIYRQSKTGIPTEFVVAHDYEVSDCDLVERLVHEKLKKYRVDNDREFFNVQLKDAIKAIDSVIHDLEKQHKLDFLEQTKQTFTPINWWENLSLVWKQIFRNHLDIEYKPNELDLIRAVHSIIDHCQEERLRKKVGELIADNKFSLKLISWYNNLIIQKKLFNSYLPYELSDTQIEKIFTLTQIDCSNNIAVIDLKPLEKLTKLQEINATNTSISSLEPLQNLSHLESLYLNYTKIDSLKALDKLPNLKKISCYGTDLGNTEIERFSQEHPHCEVNVDIFLTSVQPTQIKKNKKR